jgi:general secretion pathway protein D
MTSPLFPRRVAGLLLTTLVLLVGCAQERIRDESLLHMREGQFEKAVGGLQSGLKEFPDSPVLRSGLLQSRNEALARLLTEAANSRAAGRLDDAEATLKRALPFDSGGKRVNGLLAEITTERRQRDALAEAEILAQAKKPQAALRVLADALKDNPRQPDLSAMQRRLEGEARRTQARAAQGGLAETRPIALDFRDANLRTVLDAVTRNSGINFILDKDIRQDVRVTVLIRSARVEDAIDLIVSTHQLAKKVVDAQTVLIYPNTPEKQREHQEQVVRVFYLASAEAKGAAAFLRSMLRLREPYVDERTNMLAIRESAENVELAERLMALYDTNEPEVLLEVEVIEIRTSRLTDLGVKFPDSVGLTPLAPTGASGLTLGNIRGLTADRVGLGVAGLLLNLKREVGDFNTLANPRIRARNKEKAKILIGDKLPIVTTTTGQGGFVSDSVSYVDVGLKLDVEPTVYADDEVAIKISLEVSSLAREVRTSSGSLVYQIGTRTASTLLRLRDGETQLLAGLISNDERSSASRVPGLGDLPVAGRLFSAQRDESQRTELVLAITPRVLRNIRRPDASETEIWVGTEASPRVRAVGGLLSAKADANAVATQASGAIPGLSPSLPSSSAPLAPAVPSATMVASIQAPSEVAVGDVFLATIELNSTVPLRGLPMQLRFASKQLQVIDLEEGVYFRADGAPTSFTKAVESQTGTARAGILRNQATGAQGKGTVLKLRLKALSAGIAELAVVSMDPVFLGDPVPPITLPSAVRVTVK